MHTHTANINGNRLKIQIPQISFLDTFMVIITHELDKFNVRKTQFGLHYLMIKPPYKETITSCWCSYRLRVRLWSNTVHKCVRINLPAEEFSGQYSYKRQLHLRHICDSDKQDFTQRLKH